MHAVIESLAVLIAGACAGSFAGLLAHRLPRSAPWAMTRSACPHCGQVLTARDLVPVLSWLWQRGRCRHCGGRVSPRYPAIELATAAMILAAWLLYGASWATLCLAGLAVVLVVVVVVDLDWLIVPDETVIAAAVLGVAWRAATDGAFVAAAATAVGLAVMALALRWAFTRLRGMEALGLGDVKLLAAAGIWLPVAAVPGFLLLSGLLGIALGAAWRLAGGGAQFPFGPALAAALYASLLGAGLDPGMALAPAR